ncbi:MAG TPA: ACP S-malonyltransferase [Candidatus Limiplasma sp.]|nr:ACP S-malonyltransferase [Candidatus Limiplasma sp.]
MGKIAFVFAGQGAQYAGMGQSLYEASPAARQVLNEAEALRPGTLEQCFHGEPGMLNQTVNTQPCLMAVDCACAAALMEKGVQPAGFAGFSLGEIAALATSGMLRFQEAFALVLRRAEWMQACAERNPGGMAAVLKLDDAAVEAICAQQQAYPVNYNCPGQVVCAMRSERIAPFTEAVKAAGGRALPLAVSGGFHSPLMADAAEALRGYAAQLTFQEPSAPLYANKTCRPYTVAHAAEWLGAQVESPVRWTELIRNMQADGYTDFIEVGAGKTLSGLIGKIGGATRLANVENADNLAATVQGFKEGTAC